MRTRVIPTLLLKGQRLVKTVRFAKPIYIGDPINAVKIFNDKEVDELAVLDISPERHARGPDLARLRIIAHEAFMPMAYGGGITTVEQIRSVLSLGFEKVIISTAATTDPGIIATAAREFGSQSIVASIDVGRRGLFRPRLRVLACSATITTALDPVEQARRLVDAGAGELIVNQADRDGMMKGYDLDLVAAVAGAVAVPVVALGGAGTPEHFAAAVGAGAAAVAAGSMFVFHGRHRAVLITYPERSALEKLLP